MSSGASCGRFSRFTSLCRPDSVQRAPAVSWQCYDWAHYPFSISSYMAGRFLRSVFMRSSLKGQTRQVFKFLEEPLVLSHMCIFYES